MSKIIFIVCLMSFTTCFFKSKKDVEYKKFFVHIEMPDPTGYQEEDVTKNTWYFYSMGSYNILKLFSFHSDLLAISDDNADTIIVQLDQKNEVKVDEGYLFYDFNKKMQKGLLVLGTGNCQSVDVDSFFLSNSFSIALKDEEIRNNYRLVSDINNGDGMVKRTYVEYAVDANKQISDSLILFYSEVANNINYSISESFKLPGKKLYKVIGKIKPDINEFDSIVYPASIVSFEIGGLPLNKKEKDFIKKFMEKYRTSLDKVMGK